MSYSRTRRIASLCNLRHHESPREIDYLSVDTEGSEYEILAAFDFKSYDVKVITCEHNFTPQREMISELLVSNGFQRVLTDVSEWDDWYVNVDHPLGAITESP